MILELVVHLVVAKGVLVVDCHKFLCGNLQPPPQPPVLDQASPRWEMQPDQMAIQDEVINTLVKVSRILNRPLNSTGRGQECQAVLPLVNRKAQPEVGRSFALNTVDNGAQKRPVMLPFMGLLLILPPLERTQCLRVRLNFPYLGKIRYVQSKRLGSVMYIRSRTEPMTRFFLCALKTHFPIDSMNG